MPRPPRPIAGALVACCFAFSGAPARAADQPTARPEFWELERTANAAYDRKDFAACGEGYRRAAEANGWRRAEMLYQAACCEALAARRDGAFERLDQALAAGYRDAAQLGADPDLASLRADPRWPAILGRAREREAAHRRSIDPELERLYQEDQLERRGRTRAEFIAHYEEIRPREEARRTRAQELLDARPNLGADDCYHAAMIFQHGESLADIEKAEQLALRAVALDPWHGAARWLAAAARDRALMYQKRPQLYGTQLGYVPVDPTVTDAQRAAWNVPPLRLAPAPSR
jgi:hypothetical protein